LKAEYASEKIETKKEDKKGKSAFFLMKNRSGPIAPGSKPLPTGKANCLVGLSFVFTGELDSTSREDAIDLVKRYGGRVVTTPSSKTSYVVIGREAGESKLKKVRDLKLKTLDEDSLFELIENSVEKQAEVPRPSKKPSPRKKVPVTTSSSQGKEKNVEIPTDKPISDMWTVKYAPTSSSDIIGNKGHIVTLGKWLMNWYFLAIIIIHNLYKEAINEK
jgi:replication factor C subunit 1